MEKWKDVHEYKGLYQVSNLGRIKSLPRNNTRGNILKEIRNGDGYCRLSLSKNNKVRQYFLHRLVAKAFIKNKYHKPFINHINGIRTDNRIENLEWVTANENNQWTIQQGRYRVNYGEDCNIAKLTWVQVKEIRSKYIPIIYGQKKLGIEYGVATTTIWHIINNKTWKEQYSK